MRKPGTLEACVPRKVRLAKRLAWLGLLCLGSFIVPATTPSQTQQQAGGPEKEIASHCAVSLIVVEVEVRDRNGLAVLDLNRGSFTVYDAGEKQEMSFWSQPQDPELEGTATLKYTMGYYPPEASSVDWKFRRIRVKVRNSKINGLIVACDPQGYFVGPPN